MTLEGPSAVNAGGRVDIDFECFDMPDAPEPLVLDGFVFGIVLHAMRQARTLRVRGPMSRRAMQNLAEFQAAWHMWRPDVYQPIDVVPDAIVDPSPERRSRTAISAFSGGVDGTFTALRHARRWLGNQSYDLAAVLVVHGFDVELDNASDFRSLVKRCEPLIDRLGLELHVVRTNIKELGLQKWEDSFLPQLSACLHQYAHAYEFGLAGSSEPYDGLVLPWGSNPATDHLLSGDNFTIVHDGAGFSRTDKIEQLLRDEQACRSLKVCWEGKRQDRNCGKCEKCLRTQLNFLAAGAQEAPCFETALDIRDLSRIKIRQDAQAQELRSLLDHAKAHGRSAPAFRRVRLLLLKYRFIGPLRRIARRLVRFAVRSRR